MEKNQKYFYHKMPPAAEINPSETASNSDPWIIGVIDSSGSMSSHWKHCVKHYNAFIEQCNLEKVITYTFDDKIHEEPQKILKPNLRHYGGSMTNIVLAFQTLDQKIKKIPDEDEIKVIFLSDGQDTCSGSTLKDKLIKLEGSGSKKISMMCIGVQSGFPTFISMYLREKYHRGDATIPSIFLIEYSSDKAFFNKFQSLKKYIKVQKLIKVTPEQKLFPWEEFLSEIPENRWIVSEQKELTLDKDFKLIYEKGDFTVEGPVEIIRSWSQKLQLDSLNKTITFKQSKKFAALTYDLIQKMLEEIKETENVDLIGESNSQNSSFLTRVLNLQVKRSRERVAGYLKSINDIKNGLDLSKLNEYEAAKIIGLGTVVGTHQQRALAMRNITTEKLKKMIKEFIEVFNKIEKNQETDLPLCSITGRNLSTFFNDPSLISGLEKINSPIYFLDLFCLSGVPVIVKRNDGNKTDPSKIELVTVSEEFPIMDTQAFDFATYKYLENSGKEEIAYNAVIPLLSKKDTWMAPLLQTELFRYYNSYNWCWEIDQVNSGVASVALHQLFANIYKSKRKDKEKMLDLIVSTVDCFKSEFEPLIEALLSSDSDSIIKNLKSIEQLMLVVYYISKTNSELDSDEKKELLERVWIEYFYQKFLIGNRSVQDFVSKAGEAETTKKLLAKFNGKYLLKKFFTGGEMRRFIQKNIKNEISKINSSGEDTIVVTLSGINSDVNDKTTGKMMTTLSKDILGDEWKLEENFILNLISHVYTFKIKRQEEVLEENESKAKKVVAGVLGETSSGALIQKNRSALLEHCNIIYPKEFRKIHWNVKPMSWEDIVEECKIRNIDSSKLIYDPKKKMCSNACMARDCPFFLVPSSKKMRNHMGGWQGMLPKGFHLFIANNGHKTEDQLFGEFLSRENIKNLAFYKTDEKDVRDYIKLVKSNL